MCGRRRRPSDEQIELWAAIDRRLAEVTRAAADAAESLLVGPERGAFTLAELALREVRFESDGTCVVFFGFPREDECEMWPMVTFAGNSVVKAEWTV